MGMLRLSHLLAIVPISILLTVSFFVLLALRKVEEKALKAFGYVAASLLWLAALVIFSGAVFNMAKGFVNAKCMMQQRMKADCMSQMMQQNNMPAMAMPGKAAFSKDKRHSGAGQCGGNKGFISKAE